MKSFALPLLSRAATAGALLVLMSGVSGCAHNYRVKVDAIQNPRIVTGNSYRIESRVASLAATDPNYADALRVVKAALSGRGMYEAPRAEQAEVVVEIDYGMSPQRLKVFNFEGDFEPTLSRAPLAIIPLRKPDGSVGFAAIPAEKLGDDGTYNGQKVLRGTYVFEKYLSIVARESEVTAAPGRKPAEAWRVDVKVEDSKDSLKGYMPVLAAAAADRLGSDTQKQQKFRLPENSEAIAFVERGE